MSDGMMPDEAISQGVQPSSGRPQHSFRMRTISGGPRLRQPGRRRQARDLARSGLLHHLLRARHGRARVLHPRRATSTPPASTSLPRPRGLDARRARGHATSAPPAPTARSTSASRRAAPTSSSAARLTAELDGSLRALPGAAPGRRPVSRISVRWCVPASRDAASAAATKDERRRSSADEADIIPYDGETVVLDDLVRDELLLGDPHDPLVFRGLPGYQATPPRRAQRARRSSDAHRSAPLAPARASRSTDRPRRRSSPVAVPKRRTSRSKRNMRRANHDKVTAPNLVAVPQLRRARRPAPRLRVVRPLQGPRGQAPRRRVSADASRTRAAYVPRTARPRLRTRRR